MRMLILLTSCFIGFHAKAQECRPNTWSVVDPCRQSVQGQSNLPAAGSIGETLPAPNAQTPPPKPYVPVSIEPEGVDTRVEVGVTTWEDGNSPRTQTGANRVPAVGAEGARSAR